MRPLLIQTLSNSQNCFTNFQNQTKQNKTHHNPTQQSSSQLVIDRNGFLSFLQDNRTEEKYFFIGVKQ